MSKLLFFLLFVLPISAFSQNWVEVGESDSDVFLVNEETIKTIDKKIYFWVCREPISETERVKQAKSKGDSKDPKDLMKWAEYSYTLCYYVYDQSKSGCVILSILDYDKNRSVLWQSSIEENWEHVDYIVPGTIFMDVVRWVEDYVRSYN